MFNHEFVVQIHTTYEDKNPQAENLIQSGPNMVVTLSNWQKPMLILLRRAQLQSRAQIFPRDRIPKKKEPTIKKITKQIRKIRQNEWETYNRPKHERSTNGILRHQKQNNHIGCDLRNKRQACKYEQKNKSP